jgi:septal ring factor EnvC (AmiA/AmiB activator)
MQFKFYYPLLFLALLCSVNISAQKSKRNVLEARRTQIQKDIIYINALLSNTKRKESNLLNDVKDLKDKIRKREDLISVITNESKELGNEIYLNQLQINKNERNLESLKKNYANMIYKSYKSKSQHSRVMFLLSSESFLQAYKRLQYMKQYAKHRKMQGENIKKKSVVLEELNQGLLEDKKKKILEERKAKLEAKRKQDSIAKVKKNNN